MRSLSRRLSARSLKARASAVARQFIPDPRELVTLPHEHPDPIGDDALSPLPGIVHRYADRVLLKPVLVCPVYCRFCFRREHVGPGGGALTPAQTDAALDYIRARPAIREVILTGGDPLMLSPRRLAELLAALAAIPHVELLRLHSRVPVADPGRVTPALAAALGVETPTYLVVHANHAERVHAGGAGGAAPGGVRGGAAARPVGPAAGCERQRASP